MPTYTVHESSEASADRVDRASELMFVKDGFSWLTGLFPPLGLAASQLWLPLVAYLVFVGVGVVALAALGVSENSISIVVLAVNVFLGFEHSTLQRWTLDNAGWQTLGTVTGKTLDECERRFLEQWLPAQPMIASGNNGPVNGKTSNGKSATGWRNPWSTLGHKA